jgi:HAD superfamily hydrolase (TIGR01509 family)
MRPYRGVLLDVDGTLVDSNDAHAHAWEAALARAGLGVAFARIRSLIGMGGTQLIQQLTGLAPEDRTHRAIAKARGEIFRSQWLPRIRPLLDARRFVLRLVDAQYRFAIASSAHAEELEPLLEIADVADLCALRTTASDVERAKPEPDVIDAALAKLGTPRSQVVMIGDSPYDVAAARTARVDTIGVTTGGFTAEQLAGCIAVFDGPAGLLAAWDESPLAG